MNLVKPLFVCLGMCFASLIGRADLPRQVLVFSKSAGYEHAISYRDTAWPSALETTLLKLGNENHIFFTFSKDGSIFTPENIARYDAFVFYTSGDLIQDRRNGWGDNYPMMTSGGRNALLQAVRQGKGFMAVHSALDTFNGAPEMTNDYLRMLGAKYAGQGDLQKGRLIPVDPTFPGMEAVPQDYQPFDQWYALKDFRPDLHVILALDCHSVKGSLYERPNYPIAWARREGQGRVFCIALGHTAKIWKDPVFQHIILGGIHWVSGEVNADVTPNFNERTPHANQVSPASGKVEAGAAAKLD